MHKNIKTVAGCLSRVTCDITAPEGVDKTLTAFLVYEGESRPATLESADVIIFPAVPYGHYAYEIRCGGKPVAFGHLLARASAFPHTEGVVDYTLEADLSTTEAAQIELTLTPGPRGPQGEQGEAGAPLRYEDLTPEQKAELSAPITAHAQDASAHVSPAEREAWNAAAAGGGVDVLLSGANTFTGSNVFADNFSVLPLGQSTALGAPAFGLHVSSSGGLQLFGTHFLLSDMWSDHSLKVVNDTVCLSSSEQAALGFDYANKVVFRTMPNDGSTANDSAGAVYEFQGWQWSDDSHTERMACPVDIRKAAAGALSDDSLLNRAEGDERWVRGHLIAASANHYTNTRASISSSYGGSLSVGGYASCSKNDATAVGFHARTLNTGGVALGCESYSSAIDACALGTYSKAQGQNAVALGREATATGQNTIAVGYKVSVSKNSGVSIGNGSKVSGLYGTAIGYNCQSTATETAAAYYGGFTAGQSCTASAPGGIALGHGATAATNKHTTALGQWCKAYGANSLVLGGYGETHGTESVAIGFKAVAKANQSVAIGCTAEVNDAGCAVVASWNTGNTMRTQLYIIGAGSALAEKYYATPSGSVATNGCLAFVTKKTDGTVVATGMKKLTDLLTDNVYNAETGEGFVATLGLEDEPAPMPFLPEDGFAPIDTTEPVVPKDEPEPEEEES